MKFKVLDLIKHYYKNLLSNFLVFIVVFLLGLVYIFNIYETKYVAKTTFMIGACFHECKEESHLNVEFNKKVLFDYMELIKSNKALEAANKLSDLKYSTSELKRMVNVSYEEDTEYVKIEVTSKNKKDSSAIAYNLFNVLGSEIERIFDVNNIHLVDSDSVGYEKTSTLKLIIYDFIIAFIITVIKTIVEFLFFPKKQHKIKFNILNLKKKKSKKEVIDSGKKDTIVAKDKKTSRSKSKTTKTKNEENSKKNSTIEKKTTNNKKNVKNGTKNTIKKKN